MSSFKPNNCERMIKAVPTTDLIIFDFPRRRHALHPANSSFTTQIASGFIKRLHQLQQPASRAQKSSAETNRQNVQWVMGSGGIMGEIGKRWVDFRAL
jgi:hypothetical protein